MYVHIIRCFGCMYFYLVYLLTVLFVVRAFRFVNVSFINQLLKATFLPRQTHHRHHEQQP